MAVDISAETLKVGNALTSVRIDQMILNLAKGIAWGQYDLDKVGVDVTRMMGVPGAATIGDETMSMLEAGFLPTFYQFVDTILELRMEVKVRQEKIARYGVKSSNLHSHTNQHGGEVGGGGWKANWSAKSTSAYSRSVDAAHAQKYGQELSAASLMRTKVVPKPPPEVLVERIRLLLERLREEAEKEAREKDIDNIDEAIEEILMEKIQQRLLERLEYIRRKPAVGED